MNENDSKILIVDDEVDIIDFLSYNLKKEGYIIYTAKNGLEGLKSAQKFKPDLILMDVMMPEMDGVVACEEIRKLPELKDVVIAFLTARNEDYSQIAAFNAGADDYITKPVKLKVLCSRIKALLKRAKGINQESADENIIDNKLHNFIINKDSYLVHIKGRELSLPKKEFELLALLASKPEKVFNREAIYKAVWGNDIIVGDRTIDVHIRKLREKIGEDYIKTIKGVGYKFIDR